MISVAQAEAIILGEKRDYGNESISIFSAEERILSKSIFADRDLPPFNRVMMDGIAIAHHHFAKGNRTFMIEGVAAAGSPQWTLQNEAHCLEVMTGCPLPKQTDTVIRYEDLTINDGQALINIDQVKLGQNIHQQARDHAQGDILIKPYTKLTPAAVGIAATVGQSSVEVRRLPSVCIISTGDELVDIAEQPLAHQIRRSNVYQIQALLKKYKIQADTAHLVDDFQIIEKRLSQIIEEYDVLLMTGGVSKGKFDYIPDVLAALSVEKLFHRIQQKPGKPFWFGVAPNSTLVFALPGNPVSSFICARRYFIPWLELSLLHKQSAPRMVILNEDIPFRPNLTFLKQVAIDTSKNASPLANPIKSNGSGDFVNLINADGFIELPAGSDVYKKGELYRFFNF